MWEKRSIRASRQYRDLSFLVIASIAFFGLLPNPARALELAPGSVQPAVIADYYGPIADTFDGPDIGEYWTKLPDDPQKVYTSSGDLILDSGELMIGQGGGAGISSRPLSFGPAGFYVAVTGVYLPNSTGDRIFKVNLKDDYVTEYFGVEVYDPWNVADSVFLQVPGNSLVHQLNPQELNGHIMKFEMQYDAGTSQLHSALYIDGVLLLTGTVTTYFTSPMLQMFNTHQANLLPYPVRSQVAVEAIGTDLHAATYSIADAVYVSDGKSYGTKYLEIPMISGPVQDIDSSIVMDGVRNINLALVQMNSGADYALLTPHNQTEFESKYIVGGYSSAIFIADAFISGGPGYDYIFQSSILGQANAPIAEINGPGIVSATASFFLDGSNSHDADNDIVSYDWYLDVDNSGTGSGADIYLNTSSAVIEIAGDASAITLDTTFFPAGDNDFVLVVEDSEGNIAVSATTIFFDTITNSAPLAVIDTNLIPAVVYQGGAIDLSAIGSTDVDSSQGTNDDIIDFNWYLDENDDGQIGPADTLLDSSSAVIYSSAREELLTLSTDFLPVTNVTILLEAIDTAFSGSTDSVSFDVQEPPFLNSDVPYVGLHGGDAGCTTGDIQIGGAGWSADINLISGNMHFQQGYLAGSPFLGTPAMHYNHQAIGTGVLGESWTHSYQKKLWGSGGSYSLKMESGLAITFSYIGGKYIPKEGCCSGSILYGEEISGVNESALRIYSVGGAFEDYSLATGLILGASTPNGRNTYFDYDATGQMVEVRDHWGRSYQFGYNQQGTLTTISDPSGYSSTIAYVGGRIGSISDARGFSDVFTYDAEGRIIQVMGRDGYGWTIAYDSQDRVISVTDADNNSTLVEYYPGYTLVTDRRGATRRFEYDAAKNVLTKKVDALGRTMENRYNGAGDLIETIDGAGYSTFYDYNQYHQRIGTTDALGNTESLSFNSWGLPEISVDQNGNQIQRIYDAQNNLVQIVNPVGDSKVFAYDQQGLIISVTDELSNQSTSEYGSGLLTRNIDPVGNISQFQYDSSGRVVTVTDPLGNEVSYNYDPMGNRTQEILEDRYTVNNTYDALGRRVGSDKPLLGHKHGHSIASQSFDLNGQRTSFTDFLGFTYEEDYDEEGLITATRTPEGRESRIVTDIEGQMTHKEDDDGILESYQYDQRGYTVLVSNAAGSQYIHTIDALGRMALMTEVGSGFTMGQVYDPKGNILTETINGRTTAYSYDSLERVVSIVDPEGNISTIEYDEASRTVAKIDTLGRRTEYVYDAASRKTMRRNPDGSEVRWEYTPLSQISAYVDENGNRTEYKYDVRGRQVERVDPEGNTWKTVYDDLNRVSAKVGPDRQTQKYEYDERNTLVAVEDSLRRRVEFEYDGDGKLTARTEPDGTRRTWEYDFPKGQLVQHYSVEGDPGSLSLFEYDVAGQLISQIDENGNRRSFEYDASGQQVAFVNALGYRSDIARDADDRIVGKTYSDGDTNTTLPGEDHSVGYAYDQNNRVISKVASNSASNLSMHYTYDDAGQPVGLDGSVLTPAGTRVFSYDREFDDRGRLTNEELLGQDAVESLYDPIGLRTRVTVGADETSYQYNARNLVQSVLHDGNEWLFEYDSSGRRTKLIYPNESYVVTAYDKANQVVSETAYDSRKKKLWFDSHEYDDRGNIVRTKTESDTRLYSYNDRNWMTRAEIKVLVNGKGGYKLRTTIDYEYDNTGNLVRQNIVQANEGSLFDFSYIDPAWDGQPLRVSSTDIVYVYDAANRLVEEISTPTDGPIISVDYEYDVQGNLISKTVFDGSTEIVSDYQYTAENRLMYASSDTGSTWHTYPLLEGRGKRQHTWSMGEKTGPDGNEQEVVYDKLSRHVLQHYDNSNKYHYVLGTKRDQILGVDKNGTELINVYQNFRGDVRQVQDTSSGNVDTRNYLPFGEPISYDQTRVDFSFGYRGKEMQTTGLQDFGNRYFDPKIARAMSFDPLRARSRNNFPIELADYLLYLPGSQVEIDLDGLWRVHEGNAQPFLEKSLLFRPSDEPEMYKELNSCSPKMRGRISRAKTNIETAISTNCMKNFRRSAWLDKTKKTAQIFCRKTQPYNGCGAATRSAFGGNWYGLYLVEGHIFNETYTYNYAEPDGLSMNVVDSCARGTNDTENNFSEQNTVNVILFHELNHLATYMSVRDWRGYTTWKNLGGESVKKWEEANIEQCTINCRRSLNVRRYSLYSRLSPTYWREAKALKAGARLFSDYCGALETEPTR